MSATNSPGYRRMASVGLAACTLSILAQVCQSQNSGCRPRTRAARGGEVQGLRETMSTSPVWGAFCGQAGCLQLVITWRRVPRRW